jgi:hypothetical protein
MDRKLFEKKDIMIGIVVVFLILIFITSGGILHQRDFRDFHIWECESCHAKNGTFLLCSGACLGEGYDNFSSTGCVFPLNRSCQEISHGSQTSSGLKNADGLCFPFTDWCWIIW